MKEDQMIENTKVDSAKMEDNMMEGTMMEDTVGKITDDDCLIEGGIDELRHVPFVITVARQFPCSVLISGAIITVLMSYLSLGFLTVDDPLTGLRIRDDVSAERADAHIQLFGEIRPDMGKNSNVRQPQNSASTSGLEILYFAKEGSSNVFTVENVAKMKELEDKLVSMSGYEDYCLWDPDSGVCSTVLSPVRYLSNATTQEEIDQHVRKMWLDEGEEKDGTLLHFCREFNNVTNVECSVTKTIIRYGLPLAGYLNSNDRQRDQLKELTDWLYEQGSFEVLKSYRLEGVEDPVNNMFITFMQMGLFNREVLTILGNDVMFSAFSVCAILVLTAFHLQSIFLAVLAMLQILLSFTVSFFIYRVVLGIELFGGLNFISLYLLLGIGCDDVFIFTDALKQSKALTRGPGWTFEKRLGWAFHRAAYTMATTTTTTGFAFFMLAISEIPIVKYFGIYTALLLFVNFFMVCTLYTSALVLWHDYFGEGERWIPSFCAQKDDQNELEYAQNEKEIDVEALEEQNTPISRNSASLSRVERFFKLTYARRFINTRKGRAGVLVVTALLAFVSIILASQLEIAKEALLFWEDNHPFGMAIRSREDKFKEEGSINRIKEVYGLDSPFIDRAGTKETLGNDFGSPIYINDNFDLADPAAQDFLRNHCIEVVENKIESLKLVNSQNLSREKIGKCIMVAFALWREARNEPFPVPFNNTKGTGIVDGIPVPLSSLTESFNDLMLEFLSRPQFGKEFFANIGFKRTSEGLTPKFLTNDYAAKISDKDTFEYRTEVKKAWDAHSIELNSEEPLSLQGGETFYTDSNFFYFVWQRTQSLFLSGALTSIGLSLVLAFVMTTIATRNWILASITCATISLVLLDIVALIHISGLEMGAIESTLLTLVIGISVDYQLHVVIGYSDGQFESKINDREGRCEHALETLGTSVLAGSMTTIVSTSSLLFTTIIFFSRFAYIMVLAASTAVIYGLVVLPAILSAIGPENEQGNICIAPHMKSTSTIDTSQSSSIKTRSKKTARLGLLTYFGMLAMIGAVTISTYMIRSDQVQIEEERKEAKDAVVDLYDDSISMPNFDDLNIGEWTEFRPGNDTICARGTPYAYFIRKGQPGAPIIFELQGGGACWNPSTCQKATGTFADTAEGTRATFRRVINGEERANGMMDKSGPYQNFTYIYLPYCTGDLHWGNNIVQYSDSLTIRHKGSVNVRAVLDYVQEQIPAPPRILVTGCSAGSYGSFLWSQWISKMYEDAGEDTKVFQMGDAGMGVVIDSFLSDSFPNWNALNGGGFPNFIIPPEEPLPLDLTKLSLGKLYKWGALRFTNTTYGQASSAYDWNQAFFFKTMKQGERAEVLSADKIAWNVKMNSMYDAIKSTKPKNLVHWVAPGDYHCVRGPSHYHADYVGVLYYKRLHDYFMNGIANDVDCRDVSDDYCKQGVDLREDIKLF